MSISATSRVTPTTPHPMRRAGDFVVGKATSADAHSQGDSVAVTRTEAPQRASPVSSAARPDASFLAHLIATAQQVPQTRVLRRADVADVEMAYRAAAAMNAGPNSGRVTRII